MPPTKPLPRRRHRNHAPMQSYKLHLTVLLECHLLLVGLFAIKFALSMIVLVYSVFLENISVGENIHLVIECIWSFSIPVGWSMMSAMNKGFLQNFKKSSWRFLFLGMIPAMILQIRYLYAPAIWEINITTYGFCVSGLGLLVDVMIWKYSKSLINLWKTDY